MTSSKRKGDQRENDVANHLRSKEFLVMVSPRTMRRVGNRWFSMCNDYFGLFDICAKKDAGYTRWIQVKSDMSDYYRVRDKLKKFSQMYCNASEFVEIWVRTKKESRIVWRVFQFLVEEWEEQPKLNSKFEKI